MCAFYACDCFHETKILLLYEGGLTIIMRDVAPLQLLRVRVLLLNGGYQNKLSGVFLTTALHACFCLDKNIFAKNEDSINIREGELS